MTVVSTIKMTARQFLLLGEDPPGVRLELVDGEVAVSPSPTPEHSKIDRVLTICLGTHITENDLGLLMGDVDTIFGDLDVRRPDLLYFTKRRMHLVSRRRLEGAPDLCVEIISPSSSTTDRLDKFRQYEAGGVAHYWMIDPGPRTIEGYKLRRGKYVEVGRGQGDEVVRLPPFADLDIPLGTLWWTDPPRRRRRTRR